MNTLSKYSKTPIHTKLWLITIFSLYLANAIYGQDNHTEHDHSGHDHGEEGECAKTQNKHEGHDSHAKGTGDEEEHDHSEEENYEESHDEHGEHDEHGDEHAGPIRLNAKDMQDFGIRLATASPGIIHNELRLPGEVQMNENAVGHVSPRFDGVVTQINARLGDRVEKGDVLAKLESNETLRPFELTASIAGTVVAFHITLGESLAAGDVAYVIVDTSTVWVDLRVYQRDLPKVHEGQTVRLSAGHEYPETEGKISYVGPVIDEASRTGLIRSVIPNSQGLFRPGLFVIGNVLLDEDRLPVVVPRSAVHTMGNASVVFIQSDEGYEAQVVVIGRSDTQSIEIVEGLKRGQQYVSQGGFFLKADSQKENFGDGHAH